MTITGSSEKKTRTVGGGTYPSRNRVIVPITIHGGAGQNPALRTAHEFGHTFGLEHATVGVMATGTENVSSNRRVLKSDVRALYRQYSDLVEVLNASKIVVNTEKDRITGNSMYSAIPDPE